MDEYEVVAEDYLDLANKLRQSMFITNEILGEWMAGSAKRAAIYNGSQIRTDTIDHHIEDLIQNGFVSPVEE